ncbi:GntR family transcriptional regulator [Bradyrhizobium sp.]|uniref:GntR family transcriptional regulator n=1 Tax=Bradyrhizobium sp. TaxID=376 RepID=UPI003C5821D5
MAKTSLAEPAPPPSRLGDIASIAAAFARSFSPGVPRYLQLQNAIIGLIQAAELRAGVQLPPDQQLTGALDVSLGTVQKAFSGLASDGWISREHGRGTFIAQPRQPVTDLWHYRFRDPQSDAMLPVFSRLLKRRKVKSDDGLRRALGSDPLGYIDIERLVDIGGKFSCYSEIWLPATRFSRILALPVAAFDSVNLKRLFADEFGAPTISVEQFIRADCLSAEMARLLDAPKRGSAMVLEVTAFSYGRAPISFQRIHIPASDYPLDISPITAAPRVAPRVATTVATRGARR